MDSRAALIDHLESLGFYAYTDPKRIALAKRRAAEGGYHYGEETRRFFFCDCEDLTEGGVVRMLEEIRDSLAARSVVLAQVEESIGSDHYDVKVNRVTYRIYGPEVQDPVELWRASTRYTLALVNDLLARVGSEERVYPLGGAEDGVAVFLTPVMVGLINGNKRLEDGWIPEQP